MNQPPQQPCNVPWPNPAHHFHNKGPQVESAMTSVVGQARLRVYINQSHHRFSVDPQKSQPVHTKGPLYKVDIRMPSHIPTTHHHKVGLLPALAPIYNVLVQNLFSDQELTQKIHVLDRFPHAENG